ncbi:hypothetical protein EKO04_001721 [Ascochyta lentis]|uniref:Mitochondrial acidic protein MAM33 n=1 Tax=Ascochyta lentis TaxID=205686 RepID=A0A8H7JC08_9PLEO|nr:hypothetical protein EKO04_001721 [Ascochyta lentis]
MRSIPEKRLKDVQGEEEVKLTRNFGNETVDVLFSIAALSNLVTNPDSFAHDPYMCKSDGFVHDSQWDGAQAKNASSQGAGNEPENRIFPTDGRELMGDEVFGNFPVTMNIIVKKDGVPGVLAFDVVADDGDIRVLRMCHYSTKKRDSENAVAYSPGHRATYNGPPYGNLDEDLQRLIEEYLRARGIDATLARWVPEYVDFKEQREYVEWLSNVKSFMEK